MRRAETVGNLNFWGGNFCVYVIGPKHGRGPVKIGYAQDSEKRLYQLNVAHWEEELVIFDKFLVGSRQRAMKLENLMHDALKEHWIRGEWFRVFPDGAIDVARCVRKQFMICA